MWRSRLRATFLSNRDEVNAGDEPIITHKTGYDIYRLLATGVYFFCPFIDYLVLYYCHYLSVRTCPRSTNLFCFFCVGNPKTALKGGTWVGEAEALLQFLVSAPACVNCKCAYDCGVHINF